nr:DeoR/GlpR family DNA-binding transcription regulator [Kineococcus siccus]
MERTRGGARTASLRQHERNVNLRRRQQTATKRALARAAMAHLRPGMSLALDDSTTVAALQPHLGALRPLTIITNFLPTIIAGAADPDIDLVCLGGQYDRNLDSFDGPSVTDQLLTLTADAVVMSAAAVHQGFLLYPTPDAARRKRVFIEMGELKILLVDSTKFAARASYRVAPVALFDLVIVDADTAPEHRDALAAAGVAVEVVEVLPADDEPVPPTSPT